MSHKVNTRNSKSRKFPRDSSYLNEKILSLKQSRKGYCSQLTKVINKVNQVIFENQNTEALKVYEYQLDNFLHEIRAITTELHDLETDESEREKIINFCTDQALRVVSIKDSIMNFYISNGKEREVKIFSELSSKSAKSRDTSKSSSDRKSKSKSNISVHSRTSVHSQLSARTRSSSSQGQSNASYFAVLERRKTAEHAKLLADQVEESAKRKLKILEKSLDLEKEKIENEAFEARSKAIVAEYESKLDERGHVSNDNSSVVSKSSSGHRLLPENNFKMKI